jgi:hypothetical protein
MSPPMAPAPAGSGSGIMVTITEEVRKVLATDKAFSRAQRTTCARRGKRGVWEEVRGGATARAVVDDGAHASDTPRHHQVQVQMSSKNRSRYEAHTSGL